jgi:hypothetical protein
VRKRVAFRILVYAELSRLAVSQAICCVLDGGQAVVRYADGGVESAGCQAQRSGPELVAHLPSGPLRIDEPGAVQRGQVLRHCLAGDRQLLGNGGSGGGAAVPDPTPWNGRVTN